MSTLESMDPTQSLIIWENFIKGNEEFNAATRCKLEKWRFWIKCKAKGKIVRKIFERNHPLVDHLCILQPWVSNVVSWASFVGRTVFK
jgi:hypothetical protein